MGETKKKKMDEVIIGEKGIQYGLQRRRAPPVARKRNVFGDDDEDEDEGGMVGNMLRQQAASAKNDRKVLEMQAEALKQDASIFEYDSHVDSIREARSKVSSRVVDEKVERRSKYITGLLETAEHRKREQEILKEKRLEKERAAEDHIFGTKEKFVTSAYRRKMEEEEAWKLEQERKKKEEEEHAVEKKGHMGDFYRNLFKTNVDFSAAEKVETRRRSSGGDGHVLSEVEEEEEVPPVSCTSQKSDLVVPEEKNDDDGVGLVQTAEKDEEEDEDARAERIKREREQKMKEAKERYLARKKHKSVYG